MSDSEPKQSPVAAGKATAPRSRPTLRKLMQWAQRFFAVLGVCFLIYHVCFELTAMTSDSMAPTLRGTSYKNGDRILVEKVSGWFRPPRRWKISFNYNEDGIPAAKRIVGLPGEIVSLRDKKIYINGKQSNPPAGLKNLTYYAFGNLGAGREVSCEQGYYLLGDDSRDSYDSRFSGPVPKQEFRGRAWCVVWPISRFGMVR